MSIVGTPEWDALCAEYSALMAGKSPAEIMHAGCDHAYGYCAATPTNTYGA